VEGHFDGWAVACQVYFWVLLPVSAGGFQEARRQVPRRVPPRARSPCNIGTGVDDWPRLNKAIQVASGLFESNQVSTQWQAAWLFVAGLVPSLGSTELGRMPCTTCGMHWVDLPVWISHSGSHTVCDHAMMLAAASLITHV